MDWVAKTHLASWAFGTSTGIVEDVEPTLAEAGELLHTAYRRRYGADGVPYTSCTYWSSIYAVEAGCGRYICLSWAMTNAYGACVTGTTCTKTRNICCRATAASVEDARGPTPDLGR